MSAVGSLVLGTELSVHTETLTKAGAAGVARAQGEAPGLCAEKTQGHFPSTHHQLQLECYSQHPGIRMPELEGPLEGQAQAIKVTDGKTETQERGQCAS